MNRDDFKGCEVVLWDFVGDNPVVIYNHEKCQIHHNLAYFPDGWTGEDFRQMMKEAGWKSEIVKFERTRF